MTIDKFQASANSVCYAYGYAINGLVAEYPNWENTQLGREFQDLSEKMRLNVCKRLSLDPASTTWDDILRYCGCLQEVVKTEEGKKRFSESMHWYLDDEGQKLFREFDELRFRITGEI